MTFGVNNVATQGVETDAGAAWNHDTLGKLILSFFLTNDDHSIISGPTFDGVAMSFMKSLLNTHRGSLYGLRSPASGSNAHAATYAASEVHDGVSIDFADTDGVRQYIIQPINIADTDVTSRALHNTHADSRVFCFLVTRDQSSLAETSGDGSLVTHHTQVASNPRSGVWSKAGGGSKTFTINGSITQRTSVLALVEVGPIMPRAPFARHAFSFPDRLGGKSIQWRHNSAGRLLYVAVGASSGSAAPSGDQDFNGDAMTLRDSEVNSDAQVWLYELEMPASTWGLVDLLFDTSAIYDGVALDLVSTIGFVQSVTGTVSLGTSNHTTTTLPSTKAGSKCYCFVQSRNQDPISEESGDGTLVTLYQSFSPGTGTAVALFEKTSIGGNLTFTIKGTVSVRPAAYVIWEVEEGFAGGNKLILSMAEAWRSWQERASGLLVPRGFKEPVWKPEPQVLMPTARQVKALAA